MLCCFKGVPHTPTQSTCCWESSTPTPSNTPIVSTSSTPPTFRDTLSTCDSINSVSSTPEQQKTPNKRTPEKRTPTTVYPSDKTIAEFGLSGLILHMNSSSDLLKPHKLIPVRPREHYTIKQHNVFTNLSKEV